MSDLTKASEAREWLASWIAAETDGDGTLRTNAEANARRFSRTASDLRALLISYKSAGHVPADLESNIRLIAREAVAAKARASGKPLVKSKSKPRVSARARTSDRLRDMEKPMVLGYELDRTTLAPVRQHVQNRPGADYGCDPLGNGMFRMVPSGDVVNYDERCKRLERSGRS